jgi:hypothetical protein
MRVFPARRHNRTAANLNDGVARTKSGLRGGLDEFNVSPLKAMAVNVIRYFRE